LTSVNSAFNYFDGDVDACHKVDNGDLLISWSASLDAFIWKRGPAILNQHIFKVVEFSDIIIREYLYFAVRAAMAEIRAQVHGATMQHITKPDFERILIPLPPLSEQQRIGSILSNQIVAVERAREAAEVQLEAARNLPAAYLRSLFDSNEAQEWPKRLLGEISELLPSRSIATDGDTEILAITTACLKESGFAPSGIKVARMRKSDADKSIVSSGEILIARSNTAELVGRTALFSGVPQGAVASDLTIRLWTGPMCYPPFIAAYLSYLYLTGYWKERAGGASGSMKKITRSQILELYLPVPPLSEQRHIAAILSEQMANIERIHTTLEEQLDAIDKLSTSLLCRAFDGEF
jgi:type I restriction enzyme, S subunit